MVIRGEPGWTITKEEGYTIEAKIAFKDAWNPNTTVSFSGGRAPEYIREDPDLIRVTNIFSTNLPIASGCHGVESPGPIGVGGAWRPCPNASSTLRFVGDLRRRTLRSRWQPRGGHLPRQWSLFRKVYGTFG